tara:strand:+ start:22976 stop:23260 length:285 start_codon:yes stop_codon:yes gene_type:complete
MKNVIILSILLCNCLAFAEPYKFELIHVDVEGKQAKQLYERLQNNPSSKSTTFTWKGTPRRLYSFFTEDGSDIACAYYGFLEGTSCRVTLVIKK